MGTTCAQIHLQHDSYSPALAFRFTLESVAQLSWQTLEFTHDNLLLQFNWSGRITFPITDQSLFEYLTPPI